MINDGRNERDIILDISADIVVLGIILTVVLVIFNGAIHAKQAFILITFLAASSVWKLVSPFTETASWFVRYFQAVLLVLGMIGIIALSMIMKRV